MTLPVDEQSCYNCAQSASVMCPYMSICGVVGAQSRWTPDSLTALGLHLDRCNVPKWYKPLKVPYDEQEKPRTLYEWRIELRRLYGVVVEAYRRD